jgi:hypothetical protein
VIRSSGSTSADQGFLGVPYPSPFHLCLPHSNHVSSRENSEYDVLPTASTVWTLHPDRSASAGSTMMNPTLSTSGAERHGEAILAGPLARV